MKHDKNQIQVFLDKSKKLSKRLTKRAAELAQAQKDAASFAATLEKYPTPDYRDDAVIQLVAITKLKLQSCNDVVSKLEIEVSDALQDAVPILEQGGLLCSRIIAPICEERLVQITAKLRPFYNTEEQAAHAARQTSACRAAFVQVEIFAQIATRARSGFDAIQQALTEISAVLSEALKERPDFGPLVEFTQVVDEIDEAPVDSRPALVEPKLRLDPSGKVHSATLEKWAKFGCTSDQLCAFEALLEDGEYAPEHLSNHLNDLCIHYKQICSDELRMDWAPFEALPGWDVRVKAHAGMAG